MSKERNLRKRFEKDFYELEELQKGRRTCSSSSDSDDDRNRNSSSPSDTDDDAGKRCNKHNKRKTRRAKTVSRKAGESSKVNHDQGSAGAISKRQPIPAQDNKMGLAKSKQANKEKRKKQTSQTIYWNEDTNEEVTGRHNESNYHLNSTIDYLQQHGHFNHQNQGTDHESDPSPRPRGHWSPDNSNSTDGNMHENINRGVSTGYCFTFQRTGACTQKSCKFMHVHIQVGHIQGFQSYQYNRPNKSANKQLDYLGNESSEPSFGHNYRHDSRHSSYRSNARRNFSYQTGKFVRNQICYKFRDTGFCHYGNNCKYQHSPAVVSQYSNHSVSGQHTREADQLSFFGEIRRLVNSVQNMVETHRVVYPMFHTGLQQSIPQASQGHQIFPVVNQQPL